MLHVDEGPQHQITGASVPLADGQPLHLGSDTAAQRLSSDDSLADLQVPVHPSQGQRSHSRRVIMVGHRATPSSGHRQARRLFAGDDRAAHIRNPTGTSQTMANIDPPPGELPEPF
ncbi:hypothetical protein ACFRAI_33865 [Streptomyces sp. NPDC056637]|uniref:hypothetical protein n=1 Tax=Streptomyces sp. NPDC056637 TaxID=3345886 RepID=UPI003679AA66